MSTSPLALPSGERRADPSVTVYGIIALGIAVAMVMAGLVAVYVVLKQATPVWPPKNLFHDEYLDNTLGLTALMAGLAGWWGLYGVVRTDRRQATLGLALALFLQGAQINLLTYAVRQSHISPHQNAYGAIYYALTVAVIAVYVTGIGVNAVALVRSLGGQVSAAEPQLGWGAAWYGTVVALCYFAMYAMIHIVQ